MRAVVWCMGDGQGWNNKGSGMQNCSFAAARNGQTQMKLLEIIEKSFAKNYQAAYYDDDLGIVGSTLSWDWNGWWRVKHYEKEKRKNSATVLSQEINMNIKTAGPVLRGLASVVIAELFGTSEYERIWAILTTDVEEFYDIGALVWFPELLTTFYAKHCVQLQIHRYYLWLKQPYFKRKMLQEMRIGMIHFWHCKMRKLSFDLCNGNTSLILW